MQRRQFLLASTTALTASIARTEVLSKEIPMNEKTIATRTLKTSILDAGSGPLVLMCHGFPETKHAYRHQIVALANAGYRAVAPDMRGYGGTEAPEQVDQYSVIHAVGDMVALVDALGERTAVIVGHDWGASIAWQAALMRPDRFRAIAALSVPMMGLPPVPPSKIFPQNADALFYTLYFQDPAGAEAEFNRDVRLTLGKLLHAASGEAGPRKPGDATPNPFGMVSRKTKLLPSLPSPARLPEWLQHQDFEHLVSAFESRGFQSALNYYRNLDRNWELQHATVGQTVNVPAVFMIGERDTGLSIPGMDTIIAAMPSLVPYLQGTHILSEAGHWLQQERPSEVSQLLLQFLGSLK